MRKIILTAALATAVFTQVASGYAHAAPVPCEDLKAKLESTMATTQPSPADQAKFQDLKARADERCTAEDDRRADDFYTQALALLGVKN
ncbi:hypothetical protein [Roseibium aggregatum]|uniref:Uncharacterized protein n=1 Tax=Roseibium aggregatum TaxID=187304 RepID=A0A926P3V4_9HYPH|nr:hypothetical protein [Roseibium aggregatum]MBD1546257.1 hypothetical protein [Roseibium aggregatum]